MTDDGFVAIFQLGEESEKKNQTGPTRCVFRRRGLCLFPILRRRRRRRKAETGPCGFCAFTVLFFFLSFCSLGYGDRRWPEILIANERSDRTDVVGWEEEMNEIESAVRMAAAAGRTPSSRSSAAPVTVTGFSFFVRPFARPRNQFEVPPPPPPPPSPPPPVAGKYGAR